MSPIRRIKLPKSRQRQDKKKDCTLISLLNIKIYKLEIMRRTGNRIAKAAQAFFAETGQQDKIKNYKWEFNLILFVFSQSVS